MANVLNVRLPKHRWLAILALVAACSLGRLAPAADGVDSSPTARNEAIKSIPFGKMNDETRRKVLSVIEDPTVFRRMPTKTVDCDPDLFLFLVRNPEVVVNIWQLMGAANMTAERTGPYTWKGDDGAGTLCNVELLYGAENLHILYGDGFYAGPLFHKKMYGRCVLLLRSDYQQGRDHKAYVNTQLDMFLVVDNAGVDLLARTLSPLVGSTADSNFEESAKFASRLSQTAEANGPGMARLSEKLTKCPEEVRTQFAEVAGSVSQRTTIRSAAANLPRAASRSELVRQRQ